MTAIKALKQEWKDANIGKILSDTQDVAAFMKSIWQTKDSDCQLAAIKLASICQPVILETLVIKKLPMLLKVWLHEWVKQGGQSHLIMLTLSLVERLPLSFDNAADLIKVVRYLATKDKDSAVRNQAQQCLNMLTQIKPNVPNQDAPVAVAEKSVAQPTKRGKYTEVDIFNDLDILSTNPAPKKKLKQTTNAVPFISANSSRTHSAESLNSTAKSDKELVPVVQSTATGKKKKTVRWRPDNELEQIKYFQSDTEHKKLSNARQLDRQEGLNMKQSRKIQWYQPHLLDVKSIKLESKELIQEQERANSVLSVSYFDGMSIANSPQEPTMLELNDDSKCVNIPLYSSSVPKLSTPAQVSADQLLSSLTGNSNFAALMSQFQQPQPQQYSGYYQQPQQAYGYQPQAYYYPVQQPQQFAAFQAYQQPPTYIQQPQQQQQPQQSQPDVKKFRKK